MKTTEALPRKWKYINMETDRLKVPGGWLVRVDWFEGDSPGPPVVSISTTFIPDPGWTWKLEPLKENHEPKN